MTLIAHVYLSASGFAGVSLLLVTAAGIVLLSFGLLGSGPSWDGNPGPPAALLGLLLGRAVVADLGAGWFL
jgi:hypothetical protein